MTVYLWGDAERYGTYRRAVERAGGEVRFGGSPSGCGGLLLPGGGDLEPWRYGQENTASRGLEPERDAAELALLELFTVRRLPVLGICRGLQTVNVFFGGTLCQDIPGHAAQNGADRLHRIRTSLSPLRGLCALRTLDLGCRGAKDKVKLDFNMLYPQLDSLTITPSLKEYFITNTEAGR